MKHADFYALLEDLSPTALASSWDNVGLLLEPPPARPQVQRVIIAIDLTQAVVQEALDFQADVIVAYHPPIFSGLKRLTSATPMTRRLLTLIQAGVGVWSPHTALDAVTGGMNDWLARGVGEAAQSRALQPSAVVSSAAVSGEDSSTAGMGRAVQLRTPASLETVVARLKIHLQLTHVRVAVADDLRENPEKSGVQTKNISRIALCPGAGGSLFSVLAAPADGGPQLYVTGEWGHHDVLAKVALGAHVILTEHSNTERGFLPIYADKLRQGAAGITVRVAQHDCDPLVVW